MSKWPKNARKWSVKVSYDKFGRAKITVPSQIIQAFERPDTVTFAMINGEIMAFFTRTKQATS